MSTQPPRVMSMKKYYGHTPLYLHETIELAPVG